MYKIACIMGKSSTGKDHIYKALLENEELELKNIVMYTTRPMRISETDGVEYRFETEEFVKQCEAKESIIELRAYNTVHGVWKYFTVDDGQIDLDKGKYIIIGTLESYIKYKEYFGEGVVMPIYIEVDDGIRLERALTRERKQTEPKYKELCRRFLADSEDFSEEKLEGAGISKRYYNNGIIEDCIKDIVEDLKKNF